MTRDEAIFVLEHIEAHGSLAIKAKEMAIEALKQGPCEDAISRQAALDYCIRYGKADTWDYLRNLPSVQPISHDCENCEKVTKAYFDGQYYADSLEAEPCEERPRGHWINKKITDDYRVVGICSECKMRRIIDNFCPNCGAYMRERGKQA